ncbi:hypothetical protein AMK68_00135 [candidate division KD3-62 bacterium DG_56]|uniref:HK97 gp10 family phage protein n=1 Tax=candidate division KD3-62 bacterium DG_56 TaxID=1704032 RepID=A0A0S7XQU4_9BACT|nr:MAG: hypothetical protein AMK68_00135 [candidate division KD3-62 bacterium DG_56]
MPASTTTVQVRGLDALHQRLQSGYLFKPVKSRLIEGAGKAAHKTAQRASKGQAGRGTLGRQIHVDFLHRGLVARVRPTQRVAGIAFTIEYGRRPGKRPPYRALKQWAQRAGIPTPVRALQEEIKMRGTKGVGYMKAAEEAANEVIRTGIRHTEAEIKALWNRPQ